MTIKDTFTFITLEKVSDEDKKLDELIEKSLTMSLDEINLENEVFLSTFIPRSLMELVDYEKDYRKIQNGEASIYNHTLTGLIMPNENKDDEEAIEEEEFLEKPESVEKEEDFIVKNSSKEERKVFLYLS